MDFFQVIVLAVLSLIMTLLVWLIFAYLKLKRQYLALQEEVSNHNRDISGLCSAAISVDGRISDANDLLSVLDAKIAEFEQLQQSAEEPYQNVIEEVRRGVDVKELMQKFSISRDEAVLLIRLHGAK